MNMQLFDHTIKEILDKRLDDLERYFDSDVIFYYGEIHPSIEKLFRDFVEKLIEKEAKKSTLTIVINTPGGSVETVEKMVGIIRHYYEKVYFVVPDYAMSAGTIFCMSGNRIYMDYSSSLGPIDPQVFNGKEYVPALGYLDKVDELIKKAQDNTITQAEFLILQNQDLATLSRYEQAKNLTITLLKTWLVEYKFSDWKVHGTTPTLKGKEVTSTEKQARAEQIAQDLGNNKLWHSHGRMIGVRGLTEKLRLKVEDYSNNDELRGLIRAYNDLILEYIRRNNIPFFLHSRNYF